MNYSRIYKHLIENALARNSKKVKGFHEHHILPVSLGGGDEKENLVVLSWREHFLAHALLWKIFRNKETAYAFKMMGSLYHRSGRVYNDSKELLSKHLTESNKNMPQWRRDLARELLIAYNQSAEGREKKRNYMLERSDFFSNLMTETNLRVWSEYTEEEKSKRLSKLHSKEAIAKNIKSRKESPLVAENCSKQFKGVPKRRVFCIECHRDCTINTINRHYKLFHL